MFRFFHSVDVTMYVGLEFQICAPNSKIALLTHEEELV